MATFNETCPLTSTNACKITRYQRYKILRKTKIGLVALLSFCFTIIATEMLENWRIGEFSTSKKPVISTFNGICSCSMYECSEAKHRVIHNYFRTPPVLFSSNNLKNSNFSGLFASKRTIVTDVC